MRDDERNAQPKQEKREHEALKFYYTPMDEARADDSESNPHAKGATRIPDVIKALVDEFGDVVWNVETYAGEDTVFVEKEKIREVCQFLRDDLGFNYFSDCGGIDRFTEDERYEMFYNLVSLERGKRIRVKIRIEEDDLSVPSVTQVYRAANWNEREAYDMLGIKFDGHPDLRRMYMPEDFEYHPLRKEFPLLGVPGSLPLPPQTPEGELTMDPFAAAHGSKPTKSYLEPKSDYADDTDNE
ncbi:NADH-quinone oxidoreductase subunit C [Longibacter salinarum]|uniref:NADH-quinone oxidoreductase subunit C n=1 Tax=Longibacter salinarum TaxID=1850348 RepID=A0A2A8CWZ5_9BACT|nr:NADH-quinone oxidoreductase subunit C [Longibacter salinarum]PEN13166.1 NADH-quinone oxidoreductase subunit C [Longibacter salinarum]